MLERAIPLIGICAERWESRYAGCGRLAPNRMAKRPRPLGSLDRRTMKYRLDEHP